MQENAEAAPAICVFAPWPIVSVTIERAAGGEESV